MSKNGENLMAKIGFSDDNEEIRAAAKRIEEETKHVPIIYGDLARSLQSLKGGEIDCLVGGHDVSTKYFLRGIIGAIRPAKRIYSYSVLTKGDERFFLADTGVNISPTEEQLGELMEALNRELRPHLDYFEMARIGYETENGILQIDAALDPLIAQKKGVIESTRKNVLVFPDLNSANSAYKIMQRLGGYSHIGPVLLNTEFPISDLSRGADTQEIYDTAKWLADICPRSK